jgi:hypothetical protein
MLQRSCRVLLLLVLVTSARESLAACLPDPPMDDDMVVCDGTDSTGYDASGATGLTITTDGVTVLDESDPVLDSAILISDDNTVTIGEDATINVTEDSGFGIRGGNDNFVNNLGTIFVDGANARGVSIGENTTGILPNGVVNRAFIGANGDGSVALEAGDNSGMANFGGIELVGDGTRGIVAGDRTDLGIPANISNSNSITVGGAGSIGIQTGDGWFEGFDDMGTTVPTNVGLFNAGGAAIRVTGAGAIGILAGDPTNMTFDNNTLTANLGLIDVTGTDAIGVSLGGNDLLDPIVLGGSGPNDVFTLSNSGTIRGDEDAGPLVVFRGFVPGKENRLFVTPAQFINPAGRIVADLTNVGMPDRGIAIRGTGGRELIINAGVIQGNIELEGGDDRYIHTQTASFTGTIFGGAGFDELILDGGDSTTATFDVSTLVDFEHIEVFGGEGWALENTAGFTGLVDVVDSGRLRVPTPITLGGDLSVDPNGQVDVTLEAGTPSITVQGFSTFDGTMVITPGASLTPSATPYRVVLANGGFAGTFDVVSNSGINVFTPSYDALGLLVVFEQAFVLAADTPNQRAIAQHLADIDAAGGASADLQRFIDSLDTATGDVSLAYNALSPEAYDAQTQVVVEGGRLISNLLFDRPRECTPGRANPWREIEAELPCHARSWAPWVAAIGGFRSRDKYLGHPRYDSQMGGLAAGIDAHPLEGLDLTFALSSQRGSVNVASAGESTITLTDVSGQAAWTWGPVRTQGFVSWGHGFHQDHRLVRQTQTDYAIDSRGNEKHDSDRISLAFETGAEFDVLGVAIEPLVGVDWAWVDQRPIHESGAGGFGIRVDGRDDSIGSVNGGIRISTAYDHHRYLMRQLEWMDGVWRPSIEVRWREVLDGDRRKLDARFEGSPDAVGDFTIEGIEDDGGAEIGVGMSFTPADANRLQFDVRYDAFVGSHTLDQQLFGRVVLGF